MILTPKQLNQVHDIIRRAKQKIVSASNKVTGKHEGELQNIKKIDGKGTDVVSLDKNVVRVTPNTKQRGILFNEFVETTNPTIRSASFYKNAKDDTKVSDREIPIKNFTLYAGIEDGHYKVDDIKNFKDNTLVYPVRNVKDGLDPITEFVFLDPSQAHKDEISQLQKENEELTKRSNDMYQKYGPNKYIDHSMPWYKKLIPRNLDALETINNIGNITYKVPVITDKGSEVKTVNRNLTKAELDNLAKRAIMFNPMNVTDSVDIWHRENPEPESSSYASYEDYQAALDKWASALNNYTADFQSRATHAAKKAIQSSEFAKVPNGKDPKETLAFWQALTSKLTPEELAYYDQYINSRIKLQLLDEDIVHTGTSANNYEFKNVPYALKLFNPADYYSLYPNDLSKSPLDYDSMHDFNKRLDYIYSYLNPLGYKYTLNWKQNYKPTYDEDIKDISYNNAHINTLSTNNDKPFINVVTTKGDTIPVRDYQAAILDKKLVLGNPNGGLFIANFNNLSLDQLNNVVNPYLREHPSYPVMPDMGAYSLYWLQNGLDPDMLSHIRVYNYGADTAPSYGDYWALFTEKESKQPYDPKMHYAVGVQKQGGKLNYLDVYGKQTK